MSDKTNNPGIRIWASNRSSPSINIGLPLQLPDVNRGGFRIYFMSPDLDAVSLINKAMISESLVRMEIRHNGRVGFVVNALITFSDLQSADDKVMYCIEGLIKPTPSAPASE